MAAGCSDLVVKRATSDFGHLADPEAFDRHLPTITVEPPFFSGSFASHEIFQKTYALCIALTADGIPTIAPWEYRLFSPDQGVVLGSDLTQLMHAEGTDPYGSLRLELRVISLGGSSQVAVAGAVDVDSEERAEVIVRLRSLRTDDVVVEVVIGYVEDPLGEDIDTRDRLPGLERALAEASRQLAALLAERFDQGAAGEPPRASLAFNPRSMFDVEYSGRPPLKQQLKGLDAMELLAHSLRYYQYFWPGIGVDDLEVMSGLPGGIRVLDPGQLTTLGVQGGDFIQSVNGSPALGPQALARPFLRGHSAAVTLGVRRGAQTLLLGAGAK